MGEGITTEAMKAKDIGGMEITPKMVESAALELAKYGFFYALSDYQEARGREPGRQHPVHRMKTLAGLKSLFRRQMLYPGTMVEGKGILSPYITLYRPRAYYPQMVLGELRSTRKRAGEGLSSLPHILPVVKLPPLPDGNLVYFLYPEEAELFHRYEFPQDLREVLTRDYLRVPLVLPPNYSGVEGGVEFRARLLEIKEGPLYTHASIGEKAYQGYSIRGLTLFFSLVEEDGYLKEVSSLSDITQITQGSLFVESRVPPLEIQSVERRVEEALECCSSELFPGERKRERKEGLRIDHRTDHHFLRFRNRLFAFINKPFIAVYRYPHYFSLYMPIPLRREGIQEKESIFQRAYAQLTETLFPRGSEARGTRFFVDFVHDPSIPFWKERGVLRNELFTRVLREKPFLRTTVDWLREWDGI